MKKTILTIQLIVFSIFCYSQIDGWTNVDNHEITINQIAIHDSLIFGISNNLGKIVVVRSTNQGKSWIAINEFSGNYAFLTLGDSNIYVLILNSSTLSHEIYHSNIHNFNWIHSKCYGIGSFAYSFLAKGNSLFVGNATGIVYKSDNNGIDWYKSSAGLHTGFTTYCNNSYPIYCLETDGKNIYAGSSCYGIFKSEDNGDSWKDSNNGIVLRNFVHDIAVSKSMLFISSSRGLYSSIDQGGTWQLVKEDVLYNFNYLDVLDSILIVCGNPSINLSKNYGLEWFSINNRLLDTILNLQGNTSICSDLNSFYITGPSTIFKVQMVDTSFTILNYGLNKSYSNCILKNENRFIVSTKGGGVNASYDNGSTWNTYSNSLIGVNVNALSEVNNIVYAGTNNGLYASDDSCKNWNLLLSINNINCLDSFQKNLFIGTNEGIVKYDTENFTAEAMNYGLADFNVNTIVAIDSILYLGTNKGIYYLNSSIDTWHLIDETKNYAVYSITNHKCDIYFSSVDSIFMLYCSGLNIQNLNFNLPETQINNILFTDSTLIVATDAGVFFYNESVNNWFASKSIQQAFYLLYDSDFIYAGARDGLKKIAIRYIPTTIKKSIQQSKISVFPNPCINKLNIETKELPFGKLSITICNIYGQIMSSEILLNNNGIISLDIEKYNAGIYFLQINSFNKSYYAKFMKK